MFVKLAKISN